MEACSDPFVRTTVMLAHAEDMAAMYRRHIAEANSPGVVAYLRRTLAGFEDLIQQYQHAAVA